MKSLILVTVPENISKLENAESNVTVSDLVVFSNFSRNDLFNKHTSKTNTRWCNNNKHGETSENKVEETSSMK